MGICRSTSADRLLKKCATGFASAYSDRYRIGNLHWQSQWHSSGDVKDVRAALLRKYAASDFVFPFIEQRPVDGAGSEVGHVLVAVQACDG